jgi:general secretion pathway protein J
MSRMSSEISMAYLSFNRPADETRHFTYFEGRYDSGSDNLTFSSFAHLRVRKDSRESDQTIIQYFLADDPDDGSRTHLYRREDRRLHGDLPEDLDRYVPAYVLCEDVESLEFEYWDPTREEWISEWQTTARDAQPDRLPPRVMIKIGIADPEDDGEIEYFVTQATTVMAEKFDLSKK